MNGRIKSVMVSKSFGFIYGEDGQEYFFHTSGCIADFNSLKSGQKVTFEPTESPKGRRAEGVELL